jgi:hypothetical protein
MDPELGNAATIHSPSLFSREKSGIIIRKFFSLNHLPPPFSCSFRPIDPSRTAYAKPSIALEIANKPHATSCKTSTMFAVSKLLSLTFEDVKQLLKWLQILFTSSVFISPPIQKDPPRLPGHRDRPVPVLVARTRITEKSAPPRRRAQDAHAPQWSLYKTCP